MSSLAYNTYSRSSRGTVARIGFGAPLPTPAGLAVFGERINGAAILVERTGLIAYANSAAETLLENGAIFRKQARLLVPCHPAARDLFNDGLFGDEPAVRVIARPEGERIVWLIPSSEDNGRYAIVLVTIPENASALPETLLTQAFGLTAAEMRVLGALMTGNTLAEIARDFGVARRTVKAHVQKLFEKTDTCRQADLIRKALSLAPPLRVF
jgi:DNA-binding CsgD family transcriptional regulator